MKQKIDIKPLSINEAFTGRRFATTKYKQYQKDVSWLLKPLNLVPTVRYRLTLTFGLSNHLNDVDNCVKSFTDCLVKKYNFDDRQIYEMHLYKKIVSKGSEYIEFEITPITEEKQSEFYQ